MPKNVFEVGDVVILKSGGQKMIVEEVDEEEGAIRCQWFVDDETLGDGFFPADSLQRAETGPLFA